MMKRSLHVLAVLGSLVGLSCETPAAGGRRASKAPSTDDLEGITLQKLQIRPQSPIAKRYGDDAGHAPTPVESAIGERLVAAGLTHLPALSLMTRELAATAPDQLNVPPSLVDGLMARAGLVYPPPRLVVVELGGDRAGCDTTPAPGCEGAIASIAEQTSTILAMEGVGDPSNQRFGVGVTALGGGRTRMMVAVLEPAVALEPMPAAVPSGSSTKLAGRLLGGRTQPNVEVVDAGGNWKPMPVALSVDGSFSAVVACGKDGTHQVEVLAEGEHGPEVVANFPVYCGTQVPDTLSAIMEHVAPEVGAAQIARANFIYLNAERERRGLPALQWDPDAARVARKHSEDMRDAGFVGHRSPTTGNVTDRFERGGIKGTIVRENVARGYGPKGIHDSLMRSPGHRINILAPDVTHVGVGAVLGEAEADVAGAPRPVFATQNLYKKPGAGAPPDRELASTLQRRVDDLRREAGLPPLQWDAGLTKLAARGATAVGAGRELPTGMDSEVFALGFVSLQSHRLATPDFDALTTVALWREDIAGAVGLAVVRVKATRTTDASFVAVVFVAGREQGA